MTGPEGMDGESTERSGTDTGAGGRRARWTGGTVRVALPFHLQRLAEVPAELEVEIPHHAGSGGAPSASDVLDALESEHPVLRGTIREHGSGARRPYIRLFACGRDLSHDPPDAPLPAAVLDGRECLDVVGAISGG